MIVLYQAVVMFIMILVGYLCYRIHLISPVTNLQMSNILLLVVNPCIIFISFQTDFDTQKVRFNWPVDPFHRHHDAADPGCPEKKPGGAV